MNKVFGLAAIFAVCLLLLAIKGPEARGGESEKYLKWWDREYKGADDAVIGGVLYQRGEFKEAAVELEKAVNKGTNDGRVYYRLAYSCQQMGDANKAVEYYQKAIKLLEENEPKHRYDYYARYNLAVLYKDKAEGINRAIDILKGAEKNHYQEAGLHNLLGWLYWENGNKGDALNEYRVSVRLNPDQEDAQYNIGVIYSAMGKPEQARETFNKVLELNPENEKARIYVDYQGTQNALLQGKYAGLMIPEPALKFCYSGKQYLDKGQYNEAAREYETALELAPEMAAAHQGLGVVYEYNGQGIRYGDGFRIKKSIFHYHKALELDPELEEAIFNLAVLYSKNGEERKAERLYLQLIRLDPENPSAHYNLAVLYDGKDGKNQKAIYHYNRFLRLNPDTAQKDNIRERIKRLRR